MKGYGYLSADSFYMMLVGWLNPHVNSTESEIRAIANLDRRCPEQYERTLDAIEEFLLDDSLSFVEKAEIYLECYPDEEEESIEYFRECWAIIAPERPWPLDASEQPGKDSGNEHSDT